MAPRTVDAAVVQKDSLGVDEFLCKLVTLEDQLASFKLQRKVPHHHQRSRSSSKSRCLYTILREDTATTISDSGEMPLGQMRTASMSRERTPSSRCHGESCCRNFRPQIPVICQGQRNQQSTPCG
ncbi:uncharacterized protein TNCV_1106421 [Trichonephila clavipes]|nr:uncharacterized protein TNCV_1106421 [Trichonephila clavipes]